MSELNTGIYGAKRQSWKSSNPRDVLKRLIEASPHSDDIDLLYECWESLKQREDYLFTVFEYWFANNYRSLMLPKISDAEQEIRTQKTKCQFEHIKNSIKTKIGKKITDEINIALLEMILPHGKQLRDTTGKDCAILGPKVGAWLTVVASKVRPNQKIGDALSEDQIKEIYHNVS
jgi:hypothetical protein